MKVRLIGLTTGTILGLAFNLLWINVAQAHEADAFDTETYWDGRSLASWSRSEARPLREPYMGNLITHLAVGGSTMKWKIHKIL